MKIIAIRIKNLASLEGSTEINFTEEPLRSAGIFAITGATGAGKSTILDALCLALYAKTPRYLQAKETGIEIHDVKGSTISQGDVRGILRDGTAEGKAEVDFVGIDAQHYRATWSVTRLKGKVEGSLRPYSIELKNLHTNTSIPGGKTEILREIERLVGLNFEQFTRSVLLAQGDFTAFLKANKDDKSSLLEKLTGTHIYSEISIKVHEKYKQEQQQLSDLNIRKEGIHTLSDEALKDLQEEQKAIEPRVKILEKQIEALTREINWHEQLSQLQASETEAETNLSQAVTTKTGAATRELKLEQAEQAQQTRTWVDALQHAREENTHKSAALKEREATINTLQQQKELQEKMLQESEKNLAEKIKHNTEALPLLDHAKKLDTILSEKEDQLTIARDEADRAAEKRRKHQLDLEEKQATSVQLGTAITVLETWKTNHHERKPIAEKKDLIVSKLQDAQKLMADLATTAKGREEVLAKIQQQEQVKTNLTNLLNTQSAEWESLKIPYESETGALRLIPIDGIVQDKNEADEAVENITKAQAHWKLLLQSLTDFDTLNEKQTANQEESNHKEAALKELSLRQDTEKIQKDTSEKVLQKARIAATENVETLREQLVNGEACPVCGSENHPYALHHPGLDKVLAEIEKVHQENERNYLSTVAAHSSTAQACKDLKQAIAVQSQEINTKKEALQGLQQAWENFDVARESSALPNNSKEDWLAQRLQALKEKQVSLQTQIHLHTSQKQKLEAEKVKIDQLKEAIDITTNQIKDNTRESASLAEQQQHYMLDQEKDNAAMLAIQQSLNPYFTAPDWMDKWKKAPIPFLEKIHGFAKDWKENSENLESNIHQHGILSATILQLEAQSKNISTEADQKAIIRVDQENKQAGLIKERNAIFGGKPVQQMEVQLKKAVDEAQVNLDGHKEKLQQLHLNTTIANTKKEQLSKEITALDVHIADALKKITEWLTVYNQHHLISLNQEALVDLLKLTNEWMDNERKDLQSIHDGVIKATSILAERVQTIALHHQKRLSDRSLEEANALFDTDKLNLEQCKQSKNEIGFKLQLDLENKNKIGDLLKSITTQADITENWSKLDEVIGSADGKKFRQFAQEYTLDILLVYANIQLEALTNRYKIQRIPGSLGLQVIDQDMGDEVRTVFSLSGGESFLVSLALALGLAALSSSRMKVESLFIDEGFGSLDPDTLNIAMDALERLHNQGRKVSVISHVQEMTERIPTQIKVSKLSSGKSIIEVITR